MNRSKTGRIRRLFLTGLVAMPLTAFADLTIINETPEDSTSMLNSTNVCSTVALGNLGVTKAGKVNVIPAFTLKYVACYYHENDCKAEVYMNLPVPDGQKQTCAGTPIGTVVFSVKTGVIDIKTNSAKLKPYHLEGKGFTIWVKKD